MMLSQTMRHELNHTAISHPVSVLILGQNIKYPEYNGYVRNLVTLVQAK